MSFEEELPGTLDKLKISPTLAQIKFIDSQIPITLNPFFNNAVCNEHNDSTESLQTIKCKAMHRRHRFRRKSESCLDECKEAETVSLDHLDVASSHNTRCMPRLQRQPLKKTLSSNGSKRFLLREPVLRTLHNCLHTKCNSNRRTFATAADDKNNSSFVSKSNGIANFRDLISECQNLIEHDLDTKGRIASIKTICPHSKSFNTLQSKDTLLSANVSKSNESIEKRIVNERAAAPAMKMRSTATCSQQAGNGAANPNNCDDVTINELASYFDTMVHIPKKMSSMAEMMYI